MTIIGFWNTSYRTAAYIGWDGSQRDHVKEMIGRNELPSLAALSQEGKVAPAEKPATLTKKAKEKKSKKKPLIRSSRRQRKKEKTKKFPKTPPEQI